MSTKSKQSFNKWEKNIFTHVNIKRILYYLSCFLFVFNFLSLSFETALKSGTISSYSDLLTPITYSFYWPRFTLFLIPPLSLIVLSAYKRKQNDLILKGFLLLFMAPIIVSRNMDIFSAYNLIPNLNQPPYFVQLYHVITAVNAALWMSIIVLGVMWMFQKTNYTDNKSKLKSRAF